MKEDLQSLKRASNFFHEKIIHSKAILSCRNTDEYLEYIRKELQHYELSEKLINDKIQNIEM